MILFKLIFCLDLESSVEERRRRLPSINALSSSNLTLLSNWITDCKSSHATCQVQESSWLPGRLLDVGPSDGAQLPRLVETSSDSVQGKYAALSHMWGDMSNRPPLRTFLSNYDNMQNGIPISSLPKNFVEAMIVTQRLGLRYLWIDSLCIVQDSSSDWEKEAATMHEVYKYAEVTIVA